MGRGARADGAAPAEERARSQAAGGHLGIRSAARKRVFQRFCREWARQPRSGASARRTDQTAARA